MEFWSPRLWQTKWLAGERRDFYEHKFRILRNGSVKGLCRQEPISPVQALEKVLHYERINLMHVSCPRLQEASEVRNYLRNEYIDCGILAIFAHAQRGLEDNTLRPMLFEVTGAAQGFIVHGEAAVNEFIRLWTEFVKAETIVVSRGSAILIQAMGACGIALPNLIDIDCLQHYTGNGGQTQGSIETLDGKMDRSQERSERALIHPPYSTSRCFVDRVSRNACNIGQHTLRKWMRCALKTCYIHGARDAMWYMAPLIAAFRFTGPFELDQAVFETDLEPIFHEFAEMDVMTVPVTERARQIWRLRNVIAACRDILPRKVFSMQDIVQWAEAGVRNKYPWEDLAKIIRHDSRKPVRLAADYVIDLLNTSHKISTHLKKFLERALIVGYDIEYETKTLREEYNIEPVAAFDIKRFYQESMFPGSYPHFTNVMRVLVPQVLEDLRYTPDDEAGGLQGKVNRPFDLDQLLKLKSRSYLLLSAWTSLNKLFDHTVLQIHGVDPIKPLLMKDFIIQHSFDDFQEYVKYYIEQGGSRMGSVSGGQMRQRLRRVWEFCTDAAIQQDKHLRDITSFHHLVEIIHGCPKTEGAIRSWVQKYPIARKLSQDQLKEFLQILRGGLASFAPYLKEPCWRCFECGHEPDVCEVIYAEQDPQPEHNNTLKENYSCLADFWTANRSSPKSNHVFERATIQPVKLRPFHQLVALMTALSFMDKRK